MSANMLHKNKEKPIESVSDEVVIDLNKCADNPSQNRDNKRHVFSIDIMGSKKGKTSVLNYLLKDIMSDTEGIAKDGSYDEIDIEEDTPHNPAPTRRRSIK